MPFSIYARTVDAVPSGLRVKLSPPLVRKVNISFSTISVPSPTERVNSSVDSKMGVSIFSKPKNSKRGSAFFKMCRQYLCSSGRISLIPFGAWIVFALAIYNLLAALANMRRVRSCPTSSLNPSACSSPYFCMARRNAQVCLEFGQASCVLSFLINYFRNCRCSGERPRPQKCAAHDEVLVNRTPSPGIGALETVIPQNKILVIVQLRGHGAQSFLFRREICFAQDKPFRIFLVENRNLVIFNLDCFFRKTDYSFYEKLRRLLGKAEYYHFSSFGVPETKAQFVDKNVIPVFEIGLHRSALHKKRLNKIIPDGQDNSKRDNDHFHRLPNKGKDFIFRGQVLSIFFNH